MEIKTKSQIEGLIKLLLADGLPPNIKVVRIPVRKDWQGKLEADQFSYNQFQPPIQEPTEEEKQAISYQEETIQLEEMTVEGKRFLAGFASLTYSLVIGYE